MPPSDLATLALLDADQGVCPSGHRCELGSPRERRCCTCGYTGLPLVCREITPRAVSGAEAEGADPSVVEWARQYLADQSMGA